MRTVKSAFRGEDGEFQDMAIDEAFVQEQARAYKQIADLAQKYALIHAAAGGVLILAHPATQIAEGIYDKCQRANGRRLQPVSELD